MQVSLYFRSVRRRKERCNEWSGGGGDDGVEPGARKSQGSFSFNNNNNNKNTPPPQTENFMEIFGIKTVGIPPQQSQGCRVREVGESEAPSSGSE